MFTPTGGTRRARDQAVPLMLAPIPDIAAVPSAACREARGGRRRAVTVTLAFTPQVRPGKSASLDAGAIEAVRAARRRSRPWCSNSPTAWRPAALAAAARGRRGQPAARPQRPGAGIRSHRRSRCRHERAAATPCAAKSSEDWSERNQQWLGRRARRPRGAHRGAPGATDGDGLRAPRQTDDTVQASAGLLRPHFSPVGIRTRAVAAGCWNGTGQRRAPCGGAGAGHCRGRFVASELRLALRVLSRPHWDALSPLAPLRRWRLMGSRRAARRCAAVAYR